jgi:Tfp pilus assembly protein PilF
MQTKILAELLREYDKYFDFLDLKKLNSMNLSWQDKIKILENYLNKKPENTKNTSVLNTLGQAYFKAGELSKAKNCFKNIIACDPENIHANHSLGQIELSNGALWKAKKYFLKTIEIDPDNIKGLQGMGEVELNANNLDKAREYFFKVLDLKPQDLRSLNGLGRVELAAENIEQARSYFLRQYAQDGNQLQALHGLGKVELKAGRIATAKAYFEKQYAADHNQTQALHGLAQAELASDNIKEAKNWLSLIEHISHHEYIEISLKGFKYTDHSSERCGLRNINTKKLFSTKIIGSQNKNSRIMNGYYLDNGIVIEVIADLESRTIITVYQRTFNPTPQK